MSAGSTILWGIGVGPGAPDLVTLRAVAMLRKADVLALPRSSDFGESTAWSIVKEHLEPGAQQEKLFLTFPMSNDPSRVRPSWDRALAEIGARIAAGKSVAFVTEGDPTLYSTFVYLQREAPRRWPGVCVEVVPGVTSVTGVAAVAGIALADGRQRIAIVPAAYGVEDADELFRRFDTVVFMKMGPQVGRVVEAIERNGLLDRAVYVARATMRAERIVRDVREVAGERGDCFAMMVVAQKQRSGAVFGEGET
jgi:precorrin-2/cobalt-factor-2 C20-methyltransferase